MDGLYGRFYEKAIRAVSDTLFLRARKEDDYWILKQFLQEETAEAQPDEYSFLILLSIDRKALEENILQILLDQRAQGKTSREQGIAISRLIDNFFEDRVF